MTEFTNPTPYSPGDRLPIGIEVFPGREQNDMVLWIESKAAVISGDTLKDVGQGPRDLGPLAPRGRDPRAGRRGPAPAARAAGRACARDAQRAHRPGRPRARALLTSQPRSLRGQAESSQSRNSASRRVSAASCRLAQAGNGLNGSSSTASRRPVRLWLQTPAIRAPRHPCLARSLGRSEKQT